MKNLKKLLTLILALLISLPLLWSCNNDPGDENNGDDDDKTPCTEHIDEDNNSRCDKCDQSLINPDNDTEPDEIMLIKDGKANFNFVIKNGSSDLVVKAVEKLAETLDSLDVEVEIVEENDGEASECEVLIGAPENRGDDYKYDMYSLGIKGYAIEIIDQKVLILGGSDDSLIEAIEIFEEDILGISRKTKELTTVKVKKSQGIKEIQDDYRISAVKINGNDIKGYTIAADSKNEFTYPVALEVQKLFYQYAGYRLEIVPLSDADKSIVINTIENTGEGNGYSLTVSDSCITFETEFPDKIAKEVTDFFTKNVSIAEGEVNFTSKHNQTKNMRDIYYSEFGAKGDGENDDFMAIRACHEYANKWGHKVFADKNKTYYIGNATDGLYIPVKTDVDWQNCDFIFDDTKIDIDDRGSNGVLLRGVPIFSILSDYDYENVTDLFSWVTKDNPLKQGETPNIGWAPGYTALVSIQTNDRKVFIRYGPNADAGDYPHEILLVDAEGNIDPSTPLSWDYYSISSASIKRADDAPITVGNAKVLTRTSRPANNAYNAFTRNISVTRSNVTVTNLDHTLTDDYIYRTPYAGFIYASNCTNVEFSNILLQAHDRKYENGVISGTYEIGGYAANDVRYYNCRIKNFFFDGDPLNASASGTIPKPGKPNNGGCMGTNYMRNMWFEDCYLTSFDAHKGLGNVTLKNSTFEHINFIGYGDIYMENITVYVDQGSTAVVLRGDYGSSWKGNLTMKGLTLKYSDDLAETANQNKVSPYIGIVKLNYYPDFNFGYQTSLPTNILLEDINIYKYSYIFNPKDGTITETEIKLAKKDYFPIHLFYALNRYGNQDISKPGANFGGDNPYLPPENIVINNCDNVVLYIPNTAQFNNTTVTVDGKVVENWRPLYGAPLN